MLRQQKPLLPARARCAKLPRMMLTAILPLFLLLQAPNSGPVAAPDPAPASTPLAADPIADAFAGLVAQVEDDNGGSDTMLRSITTQDCQTSLKGEERDWTIDWTENDALVLEPNFIFVRGGDLQIAIVADASDDDQAKKLYALADAMMAKKQACAPKVE